MTRPSPFDILQAVIEATPDALFVKDLDGRYLVVNEAASRFLERSVEEIIGKRDDELYPEATARQFVDEDRVVLESGQTRSFEGLARSESGTQVYLVTKGVYRDRDGHVRGTYGISHDITELRRTRESLEQAREALFRAQKMEAVGQLTGGLAHDFNNILGVIMGNLDLLRLHVRRMAESARTRSDIAEAAPEKAGSEKASSEKEGDLAARKSAEDIVDAIMRATLHGRDLVARLLAFAGRRSLNPQPIDVDQLVDAMVRMIERTIGPGIRIDTAPGNAGLALIDPSALEAAVLNVAINARDAMPDGGVLTVRTSRVAVTADPATPDEPAPGAYVLLCVEDTGIGMTPEIVARAFEPFYTTKAEQGGSGLGLSMVYGFARQSGGTVTLESRPGAGTAVKIFLPAL